MTNTIYKKAKLMMFSLFYVQNLSPNVNNLIIFKSQLIEYQYFIFQC